MSLQFVVRPSHIPDNIMWGLNNLAFLYSKPQHNEVGVNNLVFRYSRPQYNEVGCQELGLTYSRPRHNVGRSGPFLAAFPSHKNLATGTYSLRPGNSCNELFRKMRHYWELNSGRAVRKIETLLGIK